jgi:hypothetical protein
MLKRKLNNSAFTLLEVLLASVIFVVTVGGLFATLSAVRAPVTAKQTALVSAVFGKQVLEYLRSQVDAGPTYYNCTNPAQASPPPNGFICTDFSLFLGVHQVPVASFPPSFSIPPNFAAKNPNGLTYTVNCADNSAYPCTNPDQTPHQVTLNIIY